MSVGEEYIGDNGPGDLEDSSNAWYAEYVATQAREEAALDIVLGEMVTIDPSSAATNDIRLPHRQFLNAEQIAKKVTSLADDDATKAGELLAFAMVNMPREDEAWYNHGTLRLTDMRQMVTAELFRAAATDVSLAKVFCQQVQELGLTHAMHPENAARYIYRTMNVQRTKLTESNIEATALVVQTLAGRLLEMRYDDVLNEFRRIPRDEPDYDDYAGLAASVMSGLRQMADNAALPSAFRERAQLLVPEALDDFIARTYNKSITVMPRLVQSEAQHRNLVESGWLATKVGKLSQPLQWVIEMGAHAQYFKLEEHERSSEHTAWVDARQRELFSKAMVAHEFLRDKQIGDYLHQAILVEERRQLAEFDGSLDATGTDG